MLGYLSKLRDLTAKAGGPFPVLFGRWMAEDLGHFRDQNYLCVCIYIYGYGSIPINTIFSGMNIHLPAILMFTRGTRF